MNIFVFDIETVPDVATGRRLYGKRTEMETLSDEEVAKVMFHQRSQETNGQNEFLRPHLQKVVAISAILRSGERFKVASLGEEEATEQDILQQFFKTIQHFTPTLVSWNGGGFDLPVLHYRALLHGINAARYWEISEREFRYNNYLNRYHERHTDLMDVLANYQPQSFVRLDEMAVMLGFPGKLGMSGDKVWETYLQGDIHGIRCYCETDALNTYLVFLRYELMRGHLTEDGYTEECQRVHDELFASGKPHFKAFLAAWEDNSG